MNFKRILSKNSLKSSSSGKSLSQSEEITRLHSEIDSLKETIETLKISIESRDAAIGTLAREKEKLYVDLKSAQRTNRNLQQQVVDERDMHAKEKDFLIEEIKRMSNKYEFHTNLCQAERASQPQPDTTIREELKSKDEVICNLCTKYLKIKSHKTLLHRKMVKLQQQSEKMCEEVILQLQENRITLDNMFKKLLKNKNLPCSSKKYLNLLKVNARLHFENTKLKICISSQDFVEESTLRRRSTSCVWDKKSNLYPKYSMNHNPVLRKIHHNQTFYSLHNIMSPHVKRKCCKSKSDSFINYS